jgi:hypothetical protein
MDDTGAGSKGAIGYRLGCILEIKQAAIRRA